MPADLKGATATMNLTINDRNVAVDDAQTDPGMPLLWVLRDVLQMTGTKYGCGVAACGACTVHVDGAAVRSCVTPLSSLQGKAVRTIEGLVGVGGPHPLQRAWVEHQVPQCGYCQSGMLMAAAALLEANRDPSDADIDAAMTNLCRCGSYPRMRAAIKCGGAPAGADVGAPSIDEAPQLVVVGHCGRRRAAGRLERAAAAQPLGAAALWPPEPGEVALNGWIKIAKDGAVVLAMNRSEMGQGVHTALAMLAAEELDVPLARVRLQQAGHDAIFGSAESFRRLRCRFTPTTASRARNRPPFAPRAG